jgi:hypothetical protein
VRGGHWGKVQWAWPRAWQFLFSDRVPDSPAGMNRRLKQEWWTGVWLKWWGAYLASVRPWVQTPEPEKEKKGN